MRERSQIARRRAETKRAGRDGLVPMGARRDMTITARALVEQAGDAMREDFATDKAFRKEFVAMLKAGASIKIMDRTCIRIVAELYKLVGEERRLVIEFVNSLGVSNESEVRRMVEAVRSAEGADVLDGIERATAYLEAALTIQGEQREMVIRRLGGMVPVPMQGRV